MQFKALEPGAHFWVKEKPAERFLKMAQPVADRHGDSWNASSWAGILEEFFDTQEVVDLKIGHFENSQDLEAVRQEIKRLQEVAKALETLQ